MAHFPHELDIVQHPLIDNPRRGGESVQGVKAGKQSAFVGTCNSFLVGLGAGAHEGSGAMEEAAAWIVATLQLPNHGDFNEGRGAS